MFHVTIQKIKSGTVFLCSTVYIDWTFAGLVSDPKVLGYCEAQYDFSPMETNQIAFKVGQRIAILSKSRGNRGWWKGKINGKV